MRTKVQINKKIKEIQKERKTLPKYSMFGTPNWDIMDANIRVLNQCLEKNEIEIECILDDLLDEYGGDFPPDDSIDEAKMKAYDWALGKTDEL